jgi:hypothetical protein
VAVDSGVLALLAVANAGVVDDRVKATERVDLVGNRPGLGRAAKVADRDVGQAGYRPVQIARPAGATRMPDDLVPLSCRRTAPYRVDVISLDRHIPGFAVY